MPTFLDLPKSVRERIYTLHLVQRDPITTVKHDRLSYNEPGRPGWNLPREPSILHLAELEDEAAEIYFGENCFEGTNSGRISYLLDHIAPRFHKLIRRCVITWDQNTIGASYDFKAVRKLKGLQELSIRVDEKAMVQKVLRGRKLHQRFAWECEDPTPQQGLAILQFPGMSSLIKLGPIQKVCFIKQSLPAGGEDGGPMVSGVLESQVAPTLMGLATSSTPVRTIPKESEEANDSYFPFFLLSPELRNRIYELLLCFKGQVQPTVRQPISQPKNKRMKKSADAPESALKLLEVNKQIYKEAAGMFYNCNAFNFEWTTHLHCFLTSIGPERQKHLRDLTIHYIDNKSGGISQVDITYPLLKQLRGLRKLTVIMHGDLAHKIRKRSYFSTNGTMYSANPAMIPGMKLLFELRGITDIQVRDTVLEKKVDALKKDSSYPDFEAGTVDGCYLKVSKALKHFNDALVAAQSGNVCVELFKDSQWHMEDSFPAIEGGSSISAPGA